MPVRLLDVDLDFLMPRPKPAAFLPRFLPGGGTPIHYLFGYVPPNGVVILELLI